MRQAEGTLLPLWAFGGSGQHRGREVTALAWSPRHHDLFAAGYGSYEFLAPATGTVALFSLKAPGRPEAQFDTPSGEPRRPQRVRGRVACCCHSLEVIAAGGCAGTYRARC